MIQESQGLIRSSTLEAMPFMQAVEEVDGNSNDLDNKSVVISIPSPTPSQEQILDHISLQALENRRQDGKFEYFDTLLEMIEDMDMEEMQKETEDKAEVKPPPPPPMPVKQQVESEVVKVSSQEIKETTQIPVTIVTNTRAAVMPQLSPLSQPSELTSNIANGSQQLRTLLSSFTTTVTSSSSSNNVGTVAKSVSYKDKPTNLPTSSAQVSRIATTQQHQTTAANSVVSSVIVPNVKQKIVSPKTSPTTPAVVPASSTNAMLQTQSPSFSTTSTPPATQSKFKFVYSVTTLLLSIFCSACC